jgi:sugar lactone lactonase YvrE
MSGPQSRGDSVIVPTHKLHLAVLCMLTGGLACAQTGLISTIAGTGSVGPLGDGGAATSATLYGPIGLAVDSNGNLFIADTNNSRIRKVSGGIITTVVGGGSGGDGLPALEAQLFNPCDVKVDSAGNIYISESCVVASSGSGGGGGGAVMNRVRRVDAATGIIRTIAGGISAGFSGDGGPPGSASQLNTPGGLAIDGSGSVYIADSGNNRVRRIDGATGIITTVAGNGTAAFAGDGGPATSASLNNPAAVAVDAAGTLYIADAGNNRIRRVDAGTGIITTLAGTGSTPYNGDGTPATAANLGFATALQVNGAGNLLLTDSSNNRVRLVDTSTGLIWTIAGNGIVAPLCCGGGDGGPATRAWLNVPAGVALSPMGPLFIAEHAGQRVRQVALQNSFVSTAVNVTASSASVPSGSPVTLAAVLSVMNGSAADVTGNVQFVDAAGNALGYAPVVNGSSSFTTSSLQMGAHSLSGQYFGDSVFGPSISLPVSVTITAPQSSVALAANPSPGVNGQPITLTATVTPSSATGTVTFFNGTTSIGTANISNGTATLAGVALMAGSYSLTAQYSGNINLPSSTSPAITLTVKEISSVTLTSSVNPSTAGQAVTFTATVWPSTAGGSVQFLDNGSVIGTYFFMSGPATFSISTLTSGTHSITASYSGDANNTTATSAALTQTVLFSSSVVVTSSPNPSLVGSPVTFAASVTPGNATGTVQFVDGTTVLGTGALAGGSASFTTSTLTQGTHYSITAVYSGDASNAGSTSAALLQTVNKVGSTTMLSASPAPSTWGQSVTLTATVTPAGATGAVQFFNGSTSLGPATIAGGQAQLTTTALPVGTDSLTAAYSGDANTLTSTSAAIQQTVNKVVSATTLSASPAPSTWGQSVTLTATVTPAGATGTVQFFNGSTSLGSATLASGQAQWATTALPVGTDSLTATYGGDANTAGSTSPAVSQTVNKVASTTALSASPSPSNWGQSVTLTATVTPAGASGSVQFFNGSTSLGSATLSSGQAQLTTTALPVGTDSLTATFSGDANTLTSTSASIQQNVNRATSTTTLSASPAPSTWGQSVTLTATVTPAGATGTVQFFNGSTSLGSATLTSGQAQLSTTALPVGTDSLTATYSGDANTAGSTSAAVSQTVNQASTTTSLTSSLNPSTFGASVTLSASVAPSNATGAVQFFNGSTLLGSANLSGGQAQFTTTALPVGMDSITASYNGDANNTASTSTVLQQTVNRTVSTTSLALAGSNPSPYGSSVTLTATVSPSSATGTVQFLNGSTSLGSANVSGGQAQFTTTTLPVGTLSLSATYGGDTNNAASTSSAVQLTVNKASTTANLAASPSTSTVGQAVTLTATVTPSSATGSVQFLNGSTVLGTANVSGGQAQFTTTALPAGTNSLTAVYSGDANYLNATSAAITQTVTKTASTTTVTSSQNPSTSGGSITFVAAVSPSAATGTVQFLDGTTVLGTATLAGGTASFATSTLSQGTHSITAVYGGDTANAGSTSAVLSQSVKVYAGLTMGISPSPAVVGQTVTITANMNSAATGSVTFTDGSTVLATVPVSSGVASYSTSSLTAGSHALGISYSGDATYVSSSASFNETVLVASSVALHSNANPTTVGQSITFTAVVTPTSATGTVQFFDGATLIATAPVATGVATFSTASFAKGSHSVSATYSGDSANAQSFSAPLTQIVRVVTSISLASSANPSTVGQSVSFSASLTPSTATGTVQFLDGSTVLSTATVNSGSAAFATSQLGAGTHSITAFYSGDNSDTAVTSAVLTQTVNVPPPAAPSNLAAAAAGSSQINLTWTASSTSGVTYNVYASTSSGFTPSVSNRIASGVASTTYSNTGLNPSTTHYYRVTAVNAGGESAATNQASATTAAVLACHVNYSVTNQWNVGFGGAITIKNTGTTPINSWTLTWTWPGNQRVTQSWNANYTQSGANVTFTNMSYNATIAPGATLSGVGFNASYSGSNPAPTAFSVNGTLCH